MSRAAFEIAGTSVPAGRRMTVEIPVSVLSDHTPMSLTAHVIHGRTDGPAVFVSGAIHGDEIIGVEIIRRLVRTPQMKQLSGTIIYAPVVNTLGFVNHSRYLPDRRDLNRSFPGAATGSLAARLACIFMAEVVARCEVGIDLHSAAEHRVNLPQIRIDSGSTRARELAEAFSAPVIVMSKLREGSLRLAARQLGKDVLVYECGEALRFDETAIRLGVRGVLRVLMALGMIPDDPRLAAEHKASVSRRSEWVRAPMGGVLRARRTIGARVKAGEKIATLSDPLGSKQIEVFAAGAGIIIGRTVLPVVNEGDALFHIAELEAPRLAGASMEALGAAMEGDPLFDEDEII